MDIKSELHKTSGFGNLELLACQVVEGFISGMHKSPFHGFSAEFAEHKIYNPGESTKHIDWKLYAKTDRLYTKRYEEETNLRCHLIVDNSSSMHYPAVKEPSITELNKISFSALASAAIMNLMKKQRDAVGMSIYSDTYDFYTGEKGSDRHHHMLLDQLNGIINTTRSHKEQPKGTDTYKHLHLIAEKLKRRSLVFLFSDMLQDDVEQEQLFEALQHLKYNKHEVILFHTYSKEKEYNFDFDNSPKKFVDVESGASINLYADSIRDIYKSSVETYFKTLQIKCAQYRIKYIPAIIENGFSPILTTFLVERQKFL
ncbi:DUF58 domain-containing protein [Dokdonia donghaensis]|uniref:DUF58 domain-containing protein n=1 Tax=Dokdonia donghaensis DSW-1 TaxID=1300343 RepID=A0A0A2GXM5_9FLAO|nr:DUF58 domain-containing protein [Dokdonia donghaensis]ANH59746.1 hypothetical protein I597_0819 [Dokdonia donghaensis DSW-1]KGO07091.1 hypothetical protein NV36_09735 [Dokdonia donghaensis DSW-1]